MDTLLKNNIEYIESLVRIKTLERNLEAERRENARKEKVIVDQINYTKENKKGWNDCITNSTSKDAIISDLQNQVNKKGKLKRFSFGPSVNYGLQFPEVKTGVNLSFGVQYTLFRL